MWTITKNTFVSILLILVKAKNTNKLSAMGKIVKDSTGAKVLGVKANVTCEHKVICGMDIGYTVNQLFDNFNSGMMRFSAKGTC